MNMSSQTRIRVPEAFINLIEDIRLLKSDGQNPNKMSLKQQEQIWVSLQKYGWTYPILTNKDGVFADGEQRAAVCKAHGEFFAPVLRLPVSEVDRRLLRQVMNKLKGKHQRALDLEEYGRIIEAGEKDNLENLLRSIGEKLPEDLGGPVESLGAVPETYELIIECKDEADQKAKYERFIAEGLKCRVLNL